MNIFESARAADCIRAAENLGLRIRRSGSKAYAACLFHADRSPSMCLYPDDGGFYCFSCHAHGDAVNLYKQALGLSALEAARRVCQDFGLSYDDARGAEAAPQTASQREQETRRRREAVERALIRQAQQEKERRVTQLAQDKARFAELMKQAEEEIVPRGGYEALAEDLRWQRLMMAVCGVQDEIDRLDAMDTADLIAWAMAELARAAELSPCGEYGAKGAMRSAYAQHARRGAQRADRPAPAARAGRDAPRRSAPAGAAMHGGRPEAGGKEGARDGG